MLARERGATDQRGGGAPDETNGNVDETAFITALHLDDPLPFTEAEAPAASTAAVAAAPPLELGGLTLEQYASLRAELVAHPAERAMVLARYRVSAERFTTIANAWQARFVADRSIEKRFESLVREYVKWLARKS